jgi:hypothetical protein
LRSTGPAPKARKNISQRKQWYRRARDVSPEQT